MMGHPSQYVISKWYTLIGLYVEKYGPVARGVAWVRTQYHHPKGRTYKNRKTLVGPWYVIPIDENLHNYWSGEEGNVTMYPKRFEEMYGRQPLLWESMINRMQNEMGYTLPFGQDVIDAIMAIK